MDCTRKMRILNLYKSIDNYLTGAAWGVKIQIHYHIYHYFTIYCSCVIYVVDHFQGGFFQCLKKSNWQVALAVPQ